MSTWKRFLAWWNGLFTDGDPLGEFEEWIDSFPFRAPQDRK